MLKSRKYPITICSIIIISCLIMAVIDGILSTNYLYKSICKVSIFIILPLIYAYKTNTLVNLKNLFKTQNVKKSLFRSFILGLLCFTFILGSYFTIGKFFNFSQVSGSLENNLGVTPSNFIFVSIYISFFNSLLEEFFFRGFAFIYLRNYCSKRFAYIFSALAFSLYHVAMMIYWFNIGLVSLLILSLFIGGIIFNFVDDKEDTIYNSWFVHMFSNFAINTIGFMLFGIL